jgi:hypothetical protein
LTRLLKNKNGTTTTNNKNDGWRVRRKGVEWRQLAGLLKTMIRLDFFNAIDNKEEEQQASHQGVG